MGKHIAAMYHSGLRVSNLTLYRCCQVQTTKKPVSISADGLFGSLTVVSESPSLAGLGLFQQRRGIFICYPYFTGVENLL